MAIEGRAGAQRPRADGGLGAPAALRTSAPLPEVREHAREAGLAVEVFGKDEMDALCRWIERAVAQ